MLTPISMHCGAHYKEKESPSHSRAQASYKQGEIRLVMAIESAPIPTFF